MADIRIKDLAVTAGSSASDDYLAVDGATNGTRKLSAYSPTFGGNVTASGNLTVSGSTISLPSTSGNVDLFGRLFALNVSNETRLYAGSSGISLYDHVGNGRLAQFTQSLLTLDKNTTIGGNLTVGAATTPKGKIDAQGAYDGSAPSTSSTPIIRANNGGAVSLWTGGQAYTCMWQQAIQDDGSNNTKPIALQPLGGNVLIGTTSDTGYRLNVKGANDAQMMLDVASGSQYTTLAFANNGSGKGFVYWDNTNNGLFAGTYSSNASLKFNTGLGVLALTLDSSQNATFAGTVKVKNQVTLNANGTVSAGTTATTIFSALNLGSANWCWVFGDDGSSGFADLVVTVGNGTAVSVISSATVYGSPAARTYTSSSTNLQLAMASGTMSVRTSSLNNGT